MRGAWRAHLLAAFPLLWLAVFFLAPLGFAVVYSFGNAEFGGVTLGFTLANYHAALSGLYLAVFLHTLGFALGASGLCLLASYPVACFIAQRRGRWRGICFALVLLPYFSSFLVRVMSLQIIFSRGNLLDSWIGGGLEIVDTPAAVFIGMVYAYLPIAVVPLALVLQRIPLELREAARDLGAKPWQEFFSITLPLSRPGLVTAALLTAVPMLGELVIPKLLGGGHGGLIGQVISAQYLQAQNYALGSAMAVLLLLIVLVLLGTALRLSRGFVETGL